MQYDYLNRYPLRRYPLEVAGADPLLSSWLAIPDVLAQRRFLDEHPELLRPARWVPLVAAGERDLGGRESGQVRHDLAVLRRATVAADTANGIERAYRDLYGGFAADLPAWLRDVEHGLGELLDDRHRMRTGARRFTLLSGALSRLDSEPAGADVRATLLRELAVARAEDHRARRVAAFDEAIELAGHALDGFRRYGSPIQEALTAIVLGTIWMDRIAGHLPTNHRQARRYYERAVRLLGGGLPVERAESLFGLGVVLQYGRQDERRANQEQAIVNYHDAIGVFERHGAEQPAARGRYLLASAYWQRDSGDRADNMERAIAQLRLAEPCWPPHSHPVQHARLLHGLALMYWERGMGDRGKNIERALEYSLGALRVFTREEFPVQYGQGLLNRAGMLQERVAGDRGDNIERSLEYLAAALVVRTEDDFPNEYAVTQRARARSLRARVAGSRPENRNAEIVALREALRIWTPEASPRDNWEQRLRLGDVLCEAGRWSDARVCFAQAARTETLLLALGTGVAGHDAVVARAGDMSFHAAYAAYRCGDLTSAVLLAERGRARSMTRAVLIDTTDVEAVADPDLRAAFADARIQLVAHHAAMNAALPADLDDVERQRRDLARMRRFRSAQEKFDAIVARIQTAAGSSHFLLDSCDADTLRAAAASLPPGHVLAYLIVTPWGGVALLVDGRGGITPLNLPGLDDALLEPYLTALTLAQRGQCLDELARRWPGAGVSDCMRAMHLDPDAPALLAAAAHAALRRPVFRALADLTWDQLDDAARGLAEETLCELVLREMLASCEPALARVLLDPLTERIRAHRAAGIALVSCGSLATLPIPSLRTSDGAALGDMCPVATIPNARLLLRSRNAPARAGVVAVGDPTGGLPWGRVEAESVREAATRAGLTAEVLEPAAADRTGVLTALGAGSVVSIACHGSFDHAEPTSSALHLAGGDTVTMGEVLARAVDLAGLRLLVLSACQTATVDPTGARDEMRTIAGAMLQAGARMVLATLWPVDDEATYLLVRRFAEEWFPHMDTETPALALVRAQRWLRELRVADLPHRHRSAPATAAVRGRARLAGHGEAVRIAENLGSPDRPFANPYFWAGLHLVGWLDQPPVSSTRPPSHRGGHSRPAGQRPGPTTAESR